MKKYIALYLIALTSILSAQIVLQETNDTRTNTFVERKPTITEVPITGYRNIKLGSTKEETIKAINSDALMILPKQYAYGNVDVSTEEYDTFLALQQNKFFKSGYFLFKDNALYSITIRFQSNQIDFLEILNALNKKYGLGSFLDASTVAWENEERRIILERPTIVKYMIMDYITNASAKQIPDDPAVYNELPQTTRESLFEGL